MFKHQINDARIKGHGNIVGNGNQVIIQNNINSGGPKRAKSGREPNNEESKKGGDGGDMIAIGFAAICAIAFAAWKFAFYADAIYLSLMTFLMVIGFVQSLTGLYGYLKNADAEWLTKRVLVFLGVITCGTAVFWSRSSYPPELVGFAARASNFKDFMCSMNSLGHQLAITHMLSICFAIVPAVLIFGANAAGAALASFSVATNWEWPGNLAEHLEGSSALWVGLVLAILALLTQTTIGFELVSSFVVSPAHDPFLRNANGFNVCS